MSRRDYDDTQRMTNAGNSFVRQSERELLRSEAPEGGGGFAHTGGGTPRVRAVANRREGPPDNLARLRGSWIGLIYTRYLKRYSIIRAIVIRVWRFSYPIYVNYVSVRLGNRQIKRWRKLVPLRKYAACRGISLTEVAPAEQIDCAPATVLPPRDRACAGLFPGQYRFPTMYVATLTGGVVFGGTNLVFANDDVICHDLYDFLRDDTSEELHGRALIDPKRQRARWLMYDEEPERINSGATFLDACAQNYAHWLTEVLPRVAVFCGVYGRNDIAVIVNEGLHVNIMESLFLVTGPEREIITLPVGRAIRAESLYITSVAGYVPFGQRNRRLPDHSHGRFSQAACRIMREQVSAGVDTFPMRQWPKRIYLRRNAGTRKITNSTELQEFLTANGYVPIETETLSFVEQVQLFQNATEVIAATGSALANAIFCRPGTRVCVLMAKHDNMIYRYWLNMLAPLGVDVSYILGEIDQNHELGIHGTLLSTRNI